MLVCHWQQDMQHALFMVCLDESPDSTFHHLTPMASARNQRRQCKPSTLTVGHQTHTCCYTAQGPHRCACRCLVAWASRHGVHGGCSEAELSQVGMAGQAARPCTRRVERAVDVVGAVLQAVPRIVRDEIRQAGVIQRQQPLQRVNDPHLPGRQTRRCNLMASQR